MSAALETELETCDNCGRDFRTTDDGADADDILCPECAEDFAEGPMGNLPATEGQCETWLADLIEQAEEAGPAVEAETFEAAGVLTRNKGLVLRMPNGAAFQITIVRSR